MLSPRQIYNTNNKITNKLQKLDRKIEHLDENEIIKADRIYYPGQQYENTIAMAFNLTVGTNLKIGKRDIHLLIVRSPLTVRDCNALNSNVRNYSANSEQKSPTSPNQPEIFYAFFPSSVRLVLVIQPPYHGFSPN